MKLIYTAHLLSKKVEKTSYASHFVYTAEGVESYLERALRVKGSELRDITVFSCEFQVAVFPASKLSLSPLQLWHVVR